MIAAKFLKTALVATVFAASALAGPPVWAERGHGHHRHFQHRSHQNYWGWGMLAGTAVLLAAAMPPTVYRPVVPAPVYVQPRVVVAPPPAVAPAPVYAEQSGWYYCYNPAGYYPYVPSCPSGWTRVEPTPPGQ